MDERPVGELERASAGAIQAGPVSIAPEKEGDGPGSADEDDDGEQSALKDWVELLVRAGIWALLIYVFLFQISVVDGESMVPTFHHDDRLVIDKLTYRVSAVGRYDVIVFETIDVSNRSRAPKDYIKRVIGLPGETVEIYAGAVWVNGQKLEDGLGQTFSAGGRDPHIRRKFVVPARQYFVLGDNRDFSKDSRIDGRQSLGFVAERQIRGLVRLRFWPWKSWTWFGRGEAPEPED